MMLSQDALTLDSDMLAGVNAYLRLEDGVEDPSVGPALLAAIAYGEAFTGQKLIRRMVREIVPVSDIWSKLSAVPVLSAEMVTGIPAEGAQFALMPDQYQVQIDHFGTAFLRVIRPGAAGRVEISYQVGMAEKWAGLPENIRQGILRMAGYLFANRDGAHDGGPPAIIGTLLRPWRQVRISRGPEL